MKTLQITQAGPYGAARKEILQIVTSKELPKGLEGRDIDLLLVEEGKQLAQSLYANVPGGLAVALTEELIRLSKNLFGEVAPSYEANEEPAQSCRHDYQLGGIKYEAKELYTTYYHWFFCRYCLRLEYQQFLSELAIAQQPKFVNATPK